MQNSISASNSSAGWRALFFAGCRWGAAAAVALLGTVVAAPLTSDQAQALNHNVKVSRLTSTSTRLRGNNFGGRYNLSCAEGFVLVGIRARAGSLVDNVRGLCRRVTGNGSWTGSEAVTAGAGGPGGSQVTRRCPSNYALSGFSGRAGSSINRLRLECTRLASNGSFNTSQRTRLSSIGGGGGSAFGLSRCNSRPARSIVGRATAFIHSIEFGCENSNPVMTTNQITAALNGATALVRTDSGASDVSCGTRMSRSGRVNIEPSNGLWNISSSSEMNRACGLPGFAVVTDRITYCSGFGSNIVGCARPGCMVVVPVSGTSARNQLWAHEFGHTRALGHRNGTGNIMNSFLNNGNRLNNSECGAWNNPVSNFFFGFLGAEDAELKGMSLETFAQHQFIHGVPHSAVEEFGAKAVPALIAMLKDPAQEQRWSNAATLLSMLDEPRGVDAVIDFIGRVKPKGPQSVAAKARANAVLSLGYSAAKGRNKKSVQYLTTSLDDKAWSKRKLRGATGRLMLGEAEVELDEEESLDQELTEYAIAGLALSGRPEARERLVQFSQTAGLRQQDKDLVGVALAEHAKVRAAGIGKYDLDRRIRAAERSELQRLDRDKGSVRNKAPGPSKLPNKSLVPAPVRK